MAMRNVGWVALGAGAVALGLGTYFGVRTLSTKSERDQKCSTSTCAVQGGYELDREARALALDSTAWFTAGIVAAGVGATLLWVSRSGTHPTRSGVLRITPFVGADRAGAQLGGNW
jgi:serine/threonine-protein kinase